MQDTEIKAEWMQKEGWTFYSIDELREFDNKIVEKEKEIENEEEKKSY